MSADPFRAFYNRLPRSALLFPAAWLIGALSVLGLYVLKVDLFGLGMPLAVLAAVMATRKWRLEHSVPPHRLYRWYWEALAWVVGATAYATAIVILLRK